MGMSISAVPTIFIVTNAALQCISRKTSYHGVRLAFHSFSQVIRALCNVQLFGPISLLMKRSPRFGSNTTDLTHSYWIVAFARAIHLASNNKLLTHYAKGTTLEFNPLSAYRTTSSGSVSPVIDFLTNFPSRYSSLSLNVSYLALEDGPPIFEQVLCRSTH